MSKLLFFDEINYSVSDDFKSDQVINDYLIHIIGYCIEKRHNDGRTQKAIAQSAGLQQPVVARFERMLSIPKLDTFLRLLKAYSEDILIKMINCFSKQYQTDLSDIEKKLDEVLCKLSENERIEKQVYNVYNNITLKRSTMTEMNSELENTWNDWEKEYGI